MPPSPSTRVYVTDHVNSRTVGGAFAEGAGLWVANVADHDGGPAVVYGILRGCDKIIHACEKAGEDYWHIDHGYFRRGEYYRVTKNARQYVWDGADFPTDRWDALGLEIKPWKEDGDFVIVVPPTDAQAKMDGLDFDKWLLSVVKPRIADGVPVIIHPKCWKPVSDWFECAVRLETWNSNAAIDAMLAGVEVCSGPESTAFGHELISVSSRPARYRRQGLFRALAYQQFTLAEMRDGTAWRLLNEPFDELRAGSDRAIPADAS